MNEHMDFFIEIKGGTTFSTHVDADLQLAYPERVQISLINVYVYINFLKTFYLRNDL